MNAETEYRNGKEIVADIERMGAPNAWAEVDMGNGVCVVTPPGAKAPTTIRDVTANRNGGSLATCGAILRRALADDVFRSAMLAVLAFRDKHGGPAKKLTLKEKAELAENTAIKLEAERAKLAAEVEALRAKYAG